MKADVKGKIVHVVTEGDANSNTFYALIMNPQHTTMYHMTGKFSRIEACHGNVEKWGKENKVKQIVWDTKLR